jgi:hypothetical protein
MPFGAIAVVVSAMALRAPAVAQTLPVEGIAWIHPPTNFEIRLSAEKRKAKSLKPSR